jgi:hypothetical protein
MKPELKLRIFFKVERRHGLHFITLLHELQNGLNHGLSKENLRKFQISCKGLQLYMKIITYGSTITYIFGVAIIYTIIYFSQEDRFYVLIILSHYPTGVYVALKTVSLLSLTIFMACSTFEYLTMRYQQINQQFKRITNKNVNSLEALIKAHNEVTVMVKDCNLLFSKLLGVAYLYSRFLVNLLLFISIFGNSLIYVRLMASVLAVFTIISLYLLSYMPAKVSTEAHRCYNTINSINARNEIPLPTKLKVRLFFNIVLKMRFENFVFYLCLITFIVNNLIYIVFKNFSVGVQL